jgi:hypothetical protein
MAGLLRFSFIGPKGAGCVMQSSLYTRNFSSGVETSQTESSPHVLATFPVPNRALLRHLFLDNGIQMNNRNIVLKNKLSWIAEQIISNFPNRKFKGIIKEYHRVAKIDDPKPEDLSGLMQAIQRVVGYGGQYKDFILTLFAV